MVCSPTLWISCFPFVFSLFPTSCGPLLWLCFADALPTNAMLPTRARTVRRSQIIMAAPEVRVKKFRKSAEETVQDGDFVTCAGDPNAAMVPVESRIWTLLCHHRVQQCTGD